VWVYWYPIGRFPAKKLIDGVFRIRESLGDFHFLEYGYTRGIMGKAKMSPNLELIRHAQSKGYSLPDNYYVVQFDRELLDNDFAKFRKPYPYYPDREKMEMVESAMIRILMPFMSAETLTWEEALSYMDLSQSPGWPLNMKYHTKREALDGDYELIKSVVMGILAHGEVDYVWRGRRYRTCYWLTSPKEEIRPLEKLANPDKAKNKVRTFMCGDMFSYIVGIMLYAKQNDNILKMAFSNHWSAVGISEWYGGWHELAQLLKRNGLLKFVCLDASHMEASFNDMLQRIVYACRHAGIDGLPFAKRWYLQNIIHSMIIDVHGNLVMKTGKNPSGGFNTLTDNGLCMMIVFLYTVSFSCNSVDELIVKYQELAVKIMGDDSIFEDRAEFADTISKASDLGFKLTLEASGPIEQCTFLSRGFYFDSKKRCYIFRPNFDKLAASVFFWFKRSSWRLAFVKLCAVRQMVYAFDDWRQEIDCLIQYCFSRHNDDMIREGHLDLLITYNSVVAALMSNERNEFLIYGPFS